MSRRWLALLPIVRAACRAACHAEARTFAAGVFLLALVVALLYNIVAISSADSVRQWDAFEYDVMGRAVAHGDGIPGTKRTPMFPLFLGAIYAAVGVNHFVPRVFLCVMLGAISALTYALGRLTVGERAARWGAVLAALYPPLFVLSGRLMSEVPYALSFVAFLWMLARAQRPGKTRRIRDLVGAGVLLGLALLTRPGGVVLVPFLVAWGPAASAGRNRALQLWRPALVLLVAAVVITPWTFRNYRVTGHFIPLSSNAGTVFIGGNNPAVACAPRSLLGPHNWRSGGLVPPSASGLLTEEDDVRLSDETQWETDRLYRQRALAYVRANPTVVMELAVHKLLRCWELVPARFTGRGMLVAAASYVALALSALGLWLSRRKWRRILPLLLAVCATVASVAATAGVPRFRHALEPVTLLLAGVAIAHFAECFGRASDAPAVARDTI